MTGAITSSTDNRSPRQTRHLSYISEFSSDIRHIKGERNVVADALSRPEVHSATFPEVPTVDFEKFSSEQDPAALLGSSSLNLRQVNYNGTKLWCDTGGGRIRPLVPLSFRRPIFDALHGLSHGGTRPTIRLISSRFVWPGMRQTIRSWCKSCMPCQASKIGRHTKAPVTVMPPATRRFGSIHVDLVGPLEESEGTRYLLTVVDRFTRWPEAFPLSDISSASCAKIFIREWLPRYGCLLYTSPSPRD